MQKHTEKTPKKPNSVNGGLYIALAICILSVICIGIYSAVINVFDIPSAVVPTAENIKETGKKEIRSPETKPEKKTETPPATQSGNVTAETDEPVNVEPKEKVFTRPVSGNILKAFSADVLVYSDTMNDYRFHKGCDISSYVGEYVLALTDGTVLDVFEDPLMGQSVSVDHGDGLISVYRNLSHESVAGLKKGQLVNSGDIIGSVGDTALVECEEAPHLHLEVFLNGKETDPANYLTDK